MYAFVYPYAYMHIHSIYYTYTNTDMCGGVCEQNFMKILLFVIQRKMIV